ncbi:MAG: ATP-binding protein [Bacillota bacterium]|uniref:ATP-binding protein n=1 Tax=Fictibacillus TaxID=1329200 RepID=UPI0018CE0C17|nr:MULTISPECIES: ATP-binding protein [unclassified Fictibacillus]MBH0157127.1 ATP-binding protein [Fictibacillus sp. 5RED26]MBH0159449.1 ATP-binding protein [Fictibacillus sp. 26RED30]MBH0163753.1 ATP-binding protein [Fictibacillus sp. 7GRE50]MBH0169622.1 ATP-binding protein [Fictibacillus sp. 18YEL24]MBH0174121.1 ATP-binding protein [Fictibacillus sp. 23RED33]
MESRLNHIIESLCQKHFQLPAERLVASERLDDYHCTKCKDKEIIFYRVHKDTEWHWNSGTQSCVPASKVPESDYYLGKVCGPDNAWEWHDSYSERCSCIKQKNVEKLLRSSEITDEFSNNSFSNFITEGKDQLIKDAYQCTQEYILDFSDIRRMRTNSIALLGQPGAGKTHLLTAIANHLIKKMQISVLYFPYVEGFDDLKDDFEKLEEKMVRMKKVDVLFIDDLFKPVGQLRRPRATEWQIEKMYALINYRYLNHLPVLISSELTVDEIEAVDEALGSRLYEMCRNYMVIIKGDKKILNRRLS